MPFLIRSSASNPRWLPISIAGRFAARGTGPRIRPIVHVFALVLSTAHEVSRRPSVVRSASVSAPERLSAILSGHPPSIPLTNGALMTSRIDDLLEHIARLEREVEAELERRRTQWRYRGRSGSLRARGSSRASAIEAGYSTLSSREQRPQSSDRPADLLDGRTDRGA